MIKVFKTNTIWFQKLFNNNDFKNLINIETVFRIFKNFLVLNIFLKTFGAKLKKNHLVLNRFLKTFGAK